LYWPTSQTLLLAGYLAPEELAILNNGLFGPMGGGGDDGNDGDVDDLGIERAFELMASLKGVGTHTIFALFAFITIMSDHDHRIGYLIIMPFDGPSERAAGMPDEQRRLVAERVAMAFMQAMGGDPDDDLFSDSE
jgi:hypothetical protein